MFCKYKSNIQNKSLCTAHEIHRDYSTALFPSKNVTVKKMRKVGIIKNEEFF